MSRLSHAWTKKSHLHGKVQLIPYQVLNVVSPVHKTYGDKERGRASDETVSGSKDWARGG